MSTTIERVIPLVGHLPASIREMLGRRLRELAGFGSGLRRRCRGGSDDDVVRAGPEAELCHLASIRNVAGYPGAIGADLLMQILGLGAIRDDSLHHRPSGAGG